MDGEADFSNRTDAQLLEGLRQIDATRYPINAARLQAALEARGYTVRRTEFGFQSAHRPGDPPPLSSVPVRLSLGLGPLGWLEQARNDFQLVGAGEIFSDHASIHVTGRRFGVILGLPFKSHVELDRAHIVNVESVGNAVRFEYRKHGERDRALTLWLADPATAERVQRSLPAARTDDFKPCLQAQVDFESCIAERAPRVPVTTSLVVANLLVFIAMRATAPTPLSVDSVNLVAWGSNFGPYTTDGDWWRLATSAFLHLSFLHLLFNVWALASIGPLIERLFGSIAFAALYAVSGIVASLVSTVWAPSVNSIGASGAILGVIGAFLGALTLGRLSVPPAVARPLRDSTAIYVAYCLAIGSISAGVDNAAHIGGFAAGFGLGAILSRDIGAIDSAPRTRARTWVSAAFLATVLLVIGFGLATYRGEHVSGPALFFRTQHWLVRSEDVAMRKRAEALEMKEKKLIDDTEVARRFRTDVLPLWSDAVTRLEAIEPKDDPSYGEALGLLHEFALSRRDGTQLCVDGLQTHDDDLIRRCNEEMARGDALVRDREKKTGE